MTPDQCPICYRPAETYQDFDTNNVRVRCRVCGDYTITERACESLDNLTEGRQKIHLLSAAVRAASDRGDRALVTTQNVDPLIQSVTEPATLPNGIDRLLAVIRERMDSPAAVIRLDRDVMYPLLAVKDSGQFAHYLREAREAGFIEWTSGDNVRLTLQGWQRLEHLTEQSRRQLAAGLESAPWNVVTRQLAAADAALRAAQNEEDFQIVGLLCRELLISLAQAVFDDQRHPTVDGVEPSPTDAKRMLESYIALELPGAGNEAARRHAKATLALANDVQHSRTATSLDAALCLEATSSVVRMVSLISRHSGAE